MKTNITTDGKLKPKLQYDFHFYLKLEDLPENLKKKPLTSDRF